MQIGISDAMIVSLQLMIIIVFFDLTLTIIVFLQRLVHANKSIVIF